MWHHHPKRGWCFTPPPACRLHSADTWTLPSWTEASRCPRSTNIYLFRAPLPPTVPSSDRGDTFGRRKRFCKHEQGGTGRRGTPRQSERKAKNNCRDHGEEIRWRWNVWKTNTSWQVSYWAPHASPLFDLVLLLWSGLIFKWPSQKKWKKPNHTSRNSNTLSSRGATFFFFFFLKRKNWSSWSLSGGSWSESNLIHLFPHSLVTICVWIKVELLIEWRKRKIGARRSIILNVILYFNIYCDVPIWGTRWVEHLTNCNGLQSTGWRWRLALVKRWVVSVVWTVFVSVSNLDATFLNMFLFQAPICEFFCCISTP